MKVSSVSLESKAVFPFINSKWNELNLYTHEIMSKLQKNFVEEGQME